MFSALKIKMVLWLRSLIYGPRGEPYRIGTHLLRFTPNTRPMRLKYANSANANVRYDALQIKLFSEQLGEGDVAIDIGAHAGQYCILMAAMCGASGKVIAFEPDPHARKQLNHNLDLNPGVKRAHVEALAVSDAPGEAVLFSMGGDTQSSLARSGIGESKAINAEQIRVPLVTLDGYISDRGLPTPRWVKIDTEGAEIRILKGAPVLLAGPANIVCELHPYAWDEFGNSFEELKALVTSSGRRMRYLDQDTELTEAPQYGSVLLERRD